MAYQNLDSLAALNGGVVVWWGFITDYNTTPGWTRSHIALNVMIPGLVWSAAYTRWSATYNEWSATYNEWSATYNGWSAIFVQIIRPL